MIIEKNAGRGQNEVEPTKNLGGRRGTHTGEAGRSAWQYKDECSVLGAKEAPCSFSFPFRNMWAPPLHAEFEK